MGFNGLTEERRLFHCQQPREAQFSEAAGYPMVQHWRVRSNLYKVKLSSITLSSGFSKILKTLSADSSRDELLAFLQQFGTHYVSEALYGSELRCSIHFPSKKSQQQLWLQYQKVLPVYHQGAAATA
uniref:MACPF domain-containing protein n=1 Tax=Knipowitschia caucasica TaxID=637954 RepID=A0AAV2IWA5_KNICA